MAHEVTPAELVLLGLLAERPRHGYELDLVIAERGMREWTPLAFSSVYYLLQRLESERFIEPVRETGAAAANSGRRRTTYAITKAGRAAAGEASLRVLTEVAPTPAPAMIGLANLHVVGAAAAAAALHARAARLDAEIDRLLTAADELAGSAGPPVARVVTTALFDYAVTQLRAERGWVSRTISSLEELNGEG